MLCLRFVYLIVNLHPIAKRLYLSLLTCMSTHLGNFVSVEQVSSISLRKDIGFKTNVSHSDALMILKLWVSSQVPFDARY
jgi:hypothetical protein